MRVSKPRSRSNLLKLKPNSFNNSDNGQFGTYIKLSRTKGVKLVGDSYDTSKLALSSLDADRAREEAMLLKRAYPSGVVPKFYAVKAVKVGPKNYRVGIVMQHLGNVSASSEALFSDACADIDDNNNTSYSCGECEGCEVAQKLRDAMNEHGIEHRDLHSGNIMRFKERWYAIDFTPQFIAVWNHDLKEFDDTTWVS